MKLAPALLLSLSTSSSAASLPHDPSLPWLWEGRVVGELPSGCVNGADDFCVARCLETDIKLTSCCSNGLWNLNSDVTICDEKCDQVDGYDLDRATCDLEVFGFADTNRLDDVPKFVQTYAAPPATSMPDNLRVVFLGDGNGRTSVYRAAASFNPDLVIFNADMDYGTRNGNPERWMSDFDSHFGRDMPFFATIGNHDSCMWFNNNSYGIQPSWESVLESRYRRLGLDRHCSGTIGIMNACHYKGLFMVESGIGELSGRDDNAYNTHLRNALRSHENSPWKIVSWHKNQRRMQLGSKSDSIGWNAYEHARQYGAMINNAHEHSYCRTHTMRSLASNSSLAVDNYNNDVTLDFGKTFVVTNGLAGASIRNADSSRTSYPYWASWAAGNGNKGLLQNPNQSTSYGYMGCTFKPNGVSDRADCFFRDINNREFDRFSIYTKIGGGSGPPPTSPPAPTPSPPSDPNERACRRDYDYSDGRNGYSYHRYARCGSSGTCCRSRPSGSSASACYYEAGDDSMCDPLPQSCNFGAYRNSTGSYNAPANAPSSCQVCRDNENFRDGNGYRCRDWRGYNCARDDNLSSTQRQQLNDNCPQVCGHC